MLAMVTAWRCEPGDDLPNGGAMAIDWIRQLRAALGPTDRMTTISNCGEPHRRSPGRRWRRDRRVGVGGSAGGTTRWQGGTDHWRGTGRRRGRGGEVRRRRRTASYVTDVLDEQGGKTAAEDRRGVHHPRCHVGERTGSGWCPAIGGRGRADRRAGEQRRDLPRRADDRRPPHELWHQVMDINHDRVCSLGMRAVAPTMIARRRRFDREHQPRRRASRRAGVAFAYGASEDGPCGGEYDQVRRAGARPEHGVRVNSVHPGIIETGVITRARSHGWKGRSCCPGSPKGRVASADDDVAKLVLFLASDDSNYSNGAEFVVDGAMTA